MASEKKSLARDLRKAMRRLARLEGPIRSAKLAPSASAKPPSKTRAKREQKASTNPQVSPLPGQPFDSLLLPLSPSFRNSRERFARIGGTFLPSLLSSPRSLSSSALLDNEIEYSAIDREYVWTAGLKASDASDSRLLDLRSHVTSLFHEQNHRILWRWLPPAPEKPASLRRYLNLAESLIIATDMALSDALEPKLARDFYLSGAIYDPGTTVLEEGLDRRTYRNYLQAAFHATYLNLELYDPKHIPRAISALFPSLGPLAERAARRASNLDGAFIARTNLAWQRRNRDAVIASLGPNAKNRKGGIKIPGMGEGPLDLPDDPMDNRLAYLIGEPWFQEAGF